MDNRFDFDYWNNPMYMAEVSTTQEVQNVLKFLRNERLPFSFYLNGGTFQFKAKEDRDCFIAGLETFMNLGLKF